ncbi:ATPase components of ABC transporters with duplicated ATPase domains [Streptomyces zhaozhouensis]|uniref:ATPase components of ABC transporters with duplicated ATPase domains n=1 Tax=Streptomyces zhaozhouensis TaxID=1300267 RepID=A0A286DU31_9ACTN|nr:ATP-binding cassette domain-containing protein [Streptomyces zhaozhouensis]SOD62151.1 ATPase components of ABC transporters with duplicated ATPase domains [Streptomyces zhaozhouensis]
MGFLEFNGVRCDLADGRTLFGDVSFTVGAGEVAALIGHNGAGKSTLVNVACKRLKPRSGSVNVQGGLAMMPQFIGSVRDDSTVRDLLLAAAPERIAAAAADIDALELELMERDDEATQMRYAEALSTWGEAGGYEIEVLWDVVTTAALGVPFDRARFRDVNTLSGGEQKRLVLEALLRGREQVLILDEPDNYLDVPGKRWLEEQLHTTDKAVLLVSHDRALLGNVATKIVALEGRSTWVHGGSFTGWKEARQARRERLAELHRRWDEEHARLKELVHTLGEQAKISAAMAPRYRAAQTRLRKYEEAGRPPELPREQRVVPRLTGGRTGTRVITCEQLELTGLMKPFDLEIFLGDRVAVLGSNGSGKSHLLKLLAGLDVDHAGSWRLGARVVPGFFTQTHQHPEWVGKTLVEIMGRGEGIREGLDRGAAAGMLSRYELAGSADQRFETLSGGQQARFQILLLELGGATLLLLDEPTDNLDLVSAEALQQAIEQFNGTVVVVTHDRWLASSFNRYLLFRSDGEVVETPEPVWDENRVTRAR